MSDSPSLSYIATGALILAEVVALIAGQVFAVAVGFAILIGMAAYIQDRTVTKIVAGAMTLIVIAVSLAALFPPHAPIALGAALVIGTACFAYTYYKATTL